MWCEVSWSEGHSAPTSWQVPLPYPSIWVKTVQIFSDYIRDRIRLEGFKSVRIRVRIFNIRYCILIRILKSHVYDVDIQSYPIQYGWRYPYSNPNPDKNMKTNVISVISVRIRSVFIPSNDNDGMSFATIHGAFNGWFVFEKNSVSARNLRSFMISHSQTN